MGSRISDWVNKRLPYRSMLHFAMDEKIHGGSSFFYGLGSATLFVFLIQVITGVWQMFFYVPTVDHAYISISYLRIHVPMGWLIHGLHYWGAQAMVILVGLHLIRVFIWAAFKKEGEMTWLLGMVLLILTAAMTFTGVLLPWDEVGFFAAKVGTGMASIIPLIGGWLEKLFLGGTSMGQLTLTRFFVMHVAIIPFIMFAFILVHLISFRQRGSIGPWNLAKREKTGLFWPDQIYKDIIISSVIFLCLIALSVYFRAPFSGPADTIDTSYQPKPEWNFLFLYQALKAFKGGWEPVGTLVIPFILLLFLFLIPFLDRSTDRNPVKRLRMMSTVFIFVSGVIVLTILGKTSLPGLGEASPPSNKVPSPVTESPQIKEGHQLFVSNNCMICHSIQGAGGNVGPDLSHEASKGRTKSWIMQQVKDPASHDSSTAMPPFVQLSQEQLNSLATYLLSVSRLGSGSTSPENRGKNKTTTQNVPSFNSFQSNISPGEEKIAGLAASFIGNPKHGGILFKQLCESCHGPDGKGNVPNPGSLSGMVPPLNPISDSLFSSVPSTFVENIDPIIQHGTRTPGPDPTYNMPDVGDAGTLTQQQIAHIEAFILQLNHVDRARIMHPGIRPAGFMWLSLGIFFLTGILLLIFRIIQRKKVLNQV